MSGETRAFHPPGALSLDMLRAATLGRLVGPATDASFTICTDTRQLSPGACFVALRGDNHDAHRFVPDVLRGGHAAVIAESAADLLDGIALTAPVLLVADTLTALGDIGAAFLAANPLPVAAVTGSVGKTTTRAMLASILRQSAPVLETEGNLNNRVGVPLTVLRRAREHRYAVLELGMSEPGEIRELARIAVPRVRVITAVAPAHLEFFESIEGIARAKGELFEAAVAGDTLVYWADQRESALFPKPGAASQLPFSLDAGSRAPVRLLSCADRALAGSTATILLPSGPLSVDVPIPGRHHVHDALAAAAAACAMGASPDAIAAGLAEVRVPGRRMKVEQRGGVTVLDDCYNANPASVDAALTTLAAMPTSGRRIAALGDMLELGPGGDALHEAVGHKARDVGIDVLIAVGPSMRAAAAAFASGGRPVHTADRAADAAPILRATLRDGDVLLLKGSRGMRMETALPSDEER